MLLGSQNNIYKKMYSCFVDKCSSIIILYKSDDNYEVVKADDVITKRIAGAKDINTLIKNVFLSIFDVDLGDYDTTNLFDPSKLLNAENMSGHMEILADNRRVLYQYRILAISEDVSALYFIEENNYEEYDLTHAESDLIKGNYLFSMMVNLEKDECLNSQVTELSSKSQNYFEISYTNWRGFISEMFYPEDRLTFLEISAPDNLMRELSVQEKITLEIPMKNMDGEYIWVQLSFKGVKGFSKSNPLMLYTVRDIDKFMVRLLDRDRIIENIQQKNSQLMDENKQKTSFVSSMSHEIRTPLNAIMGMNELIIRDTTNQQTLEYAKDIRNAGRVLSNVINDILDYSQIEAGMMKIVPVEYKVSTLARDCCAMLMTQSKEKGLKLNLVYGQKVPEDLYGDDIRIRQIIINLLSNSVKYTKQGTVTLSVDFEAISSSKGKLKIAVSDTGMGIRPEDIDKLTQEFVRLDLEKNRTIRGTGLGMSIVNSLLVAMGSKLNIESVYGEGSTISFEVEQGIVSNALVDDTAPFNTGLDAKNTRAVAVMVIDDITTNLTIINSFLKDTNYVVTLADSGAKGLSLMAKKKYDIVLVDHLMPEMDGIETLKKIRELGGDYENIPVIALTANTSADASKMYKKEGFCDYISKPVTLDSLIRSIEQNLI